MGQSCRFISLRISINNSPCHNSFDERIIPHFIEKTIALLREERMLFRNMKIMVDKDELK